MVFMSHKKRLFPSPHYESGTDADSFDTRTENRDPDRTNRLRHHTEDQLANVRRLVKAGTSERGCIFAVASGRGGVGKSNIALNLAMALSTMGRSVTLFDGAQRSDILLLLGRRPAVESVETFRDASGLSGMIFEEQNDLRVVSLAGPDGAREGFEWNNQDRLLREIVKQSAERDFVIIDTAAGLSVLSADLLMKADEVVVVITPEPSAVSDGYALIKVLSRSDPDIRFSALVNRVESKSEALEVYERFSLVIDHFLDMNVPLFGYVLEDRRLTRAVQNQRPILAAYPRSRVSKCIRMMAERLNA